MKVRAQVGQDENWLQRLFDEPCKGTAPEALRVLAARKEQVAQELKETP